MIDKRQFGIVIIIAFRLFTCYAAISTELVEEWGCYNSEFKLTCNDIDSKVGILEATFTPHCENRNGNQKCLYYDEDSIMKIIAQSLSRKAETYEEEYAARKLLDVLRNARLREHKETEEIEAQTSEYRSEFLHSTEVYDPSTLNESNDNASLDYDVSPRSDKRVIRDSLEKLISLYLTKLKEDSIEYNLDDNHVRQRRDLSIVGPNKRKNLEPGECKSAKRRTGTLDRIEMETALRNLTNTEFNIRKLLNYRCSGKNHCSFNFSTDHPYSTFWDEGTVHIKYICMDNFRVNKYCGELVQIGNEDWDLRKNINWTEIINRRNEEYDDELNGPRTEALRHDMNFYQVKSVKIIKTDKNDTTPTAVPSANISVAKISRQNEREKDKAKSKVYSQDFRILKVLPNDVEPEPDIEKLKKEEYVFKKAAEKEELITNQIDVAIETNEIDSVLLTTTTMKPPTIKITSSIIIPTLDIFTTASNGEVTIAQKVNKEQNETVLAVDDDDGDDEMVTEYRDLEKTVTQHATVDFDVHTTTDTTKSDEEVKAVFTQKSIDSPEKGKYGSMEEFSTESYDTDEDYDEEEDQKPKNYKYKGHQHTLPSSTLLHGFIANPGYPAYYIGSDRDCKWKIIMPKGQRMLLTILDLHLRVDEYCKDSLEIIDLDTKKSLWRGCSELTRPIQLQSLSHQIEIVLKTKSKNIYPKRGFLIHYKAIGCVVPQIPKNVKLVNRLENLLRLNCEENHVFPDTTQSDRTLICVNESWNNTLTECVPQNKTLGRYISLVNEHLRREGAEMGAENDMFGDVLVPIFIISGLFILNAIVFIIILRYRKQRRDDTFERELADL